MPAFSNRFLLLHLPRRVLGVLGVAIGAMTGAAAHEQREHGTPGMQAMPAKPARPGLGTGAAIAPDGTLWIAGLDDAGHLLVQTRAQGASEWTPRREIDTSSDSVSADGENRPKIAFGPDRPPTRGIVVITYTHPLSKPYTGEIRLLRSTDGGAHFAPPITVHQDRQLITHRFESIAFDGQGRLHAVWIDKRDQVAAPKGTPYRGAAVYRNVSLDGGASFGPDIKLADHSCECCRIALATTAGGDIAALWRHVFAPNIRDHAFAVLGKSDGNPVRASLDEWKFDACPHHGPGLAAAADGGFHAVWFGYKEGRPAVRYSRLDAGGSPSGPVRELPDAAAEHADVAAVGETVAIVWRSFDGTATRLRGWLSTDGGQRFALRELATSSDENDHPRLVMAHNAIHVVWRTQKDIHVLRLTP